jgi:hypothetical protein
MNLEKTLSTAAVVAALALPLPAYAQDRGGHERGGGHAAGQSAPRNNGGGGGGGGRQATARPAPSQGGQPAQRSYQAQGAQRSYQAQPAQRSYQAQAAPRSDNRSYQAQPAPRSYQGQQAGPRSDNRQYSQQGPRAVPRPYSSPSYRSDNHGYYGGNGNDHRGYAPAPRYGGYYSHGPSYSHGYYYARPYYGHYSRPYGWTAYRPYYFPRPYYSFSPWFSIGFGVWIGYPVTYPWAYLGSYQPHVYGNYDNSSYDVAASQSVYGGVSFDIQPANADLFVDGEYVGNVGTFTPFGEPLTLAAGQHRIAVQCNGYRAMEWDVTIEPGQVIPYRGAMQRQ